MLLVLLAAAFVGQCVSLHASTRFTAPISSPTASLAMGSWVKFIAGASNQDLPLVRNLCLLYTLAGVDCIDLCADPAVVRAADEGIMGALALRSGSGDADLTTIEYRRRPLLMVSVNDGQDLHFRKASFDPAQCPPDCPRPCEKVCPAWAIVSPLINSTSATQMDGVISDRCYGCGRCIPTCPLGLIDEVSYVANRNVINALFETGLVDAIEVHTTHGQHSSFAKLWAEIGADILPRAKVIAVSFPDMDAETLPYLSQLQSIMTAHAAWPSFSGVQIWQTDGRPMSGDVGKGAAHAATQFALNFLRETTEHSWDGIDLSRGRQYVQLAGGTNDYSPVLANSQGLLGSVGFGGFAFGGYARREIGNLLRSLEDRQPGAKIEDYPAEFDTCYLFSSRLVRSIKGEL